MSYRYSGSEAQSAGQCSPPMLQYFPLLAMLTTRSAGCLAADRRKHLQATSLPFLLQLSSCDGGMSGASFTACATQPICLYEPTVKYLFYSTWGAEDIELAWQEGQDRRSPQHTS